MAIVLLAKLRATSPEAADKIEQGECNNVLLACPPLGLKEIRDHALSDKEPGTLLYYPARNNEDRLSFTVFEEYENEEAMGAHMKSPVFQKFASDPSVFEGGLKGLDLQYFTRL